MLCQRHTTRPLPADARRLLLAALRGNPALRWPLEMIVPNRAAFWEFLDERWPIFVRLSKGARFLSRSLASAVLSGPPVLPLGHDDVRIYIDNLFEDGL